MKDLHFQELRLENFRCFRERQTARMAPLTLLVGENGTGKTSFLAAMPAILDVANAASVASFPSEPDFCSAPYDLGSFPELVHRQRLGAGAESFGIGFRCGGIKLGDFTFDATFIQGRDAAPALAATSWSSGDSWIREHRSASDPRIELGCARGAWRLPVPARRPDPSRLHSVAAFERARLFLIAAERGAADGLQPLPGTRGFPTRDDYDNFGRLYGAGAGCVVNWYDEAPFPSSPQRTYDPKRLADDPHGYLVAAFLADIHQRDRERWHDLKRGMEEFGRRSGLFDEIFVTRLGTHQHDRFRLEVRKWGKQRKGPKRNLIDVGYGVSHVLPLLMELVDEDGARSFLVQQPEAYLHPGAQAALGSLFCATAASGRQLIVETHSDYLIDRVRMDLRDRQTELKPEDVSILFFERLDFEVHIHSLRFDDQGNVLDAPASYGRFFMNEVRRSIGL